MDYLFDLTDKRAVVTGAAGDLGRAMVRGLAERGVRVLAVDRDSAALQDAMTFWDSDRISPATLDVEDETAVTTFFGETAPSKLGGLDLLVNNAGRMLRGRPEETSLDGWRDLFSLNMDAVFLCAREAGRLMLAQGRGSIVNIASIAGLKALDGRVAYCTSKAAVAHMTRVMALEWGAEGVRVNAIGPGFIKSRMNADLRKDPVRTETMTGQVPMKRFGEPDELVGALIFLASEASAYVNGQILFVDGGLQVT